MALNYTGFTYPGDVSREWYTAFIQGAPSFDLLNNLVNVKTKRNLPSLSTSDMLQADSCEWNEGGDITVTTRQIETTPMMIMTSVCLEDLESWFISAELGAGANSMSLPADFSDVLLTNLKQGISLNIERLIWRGDTASLTPALAHFDGLEKLLKADGAVHQINNVTLTAANILTELDKIIASVSTNTPVMLEKLDMPKVGIAMSPAAMQFFIQAMSNNYGLSGQYVIPAGGAVYQRFKLFQVTGISISTMLFADFSRVYLGMDLMSDVDEIEILDMRKTTAERKFRISGRFKFGVQYAVSTEMVFYRPA